jgi:hypothetical protein
MPYFSVKALVSYEQEAATFTLPAMYCINYIKKIRKNISNVFYFLFLLYLGTSLAWRPLA